MGGGGGRFESMDQFHTSGPWTPGPYHFLTGNTTLRKGNVRSVYFYL